MHGYELRKRLNATLGIVPRLQLRFAVPDAAPAAGGRSHRHRGTGRRRRRGAVDVPAVPGHLPDHRRGQGAAGRPARRRRPAVLVGRRLRGASGVLLPHLVRGADADPRGPPAAGRGAPRGAAVRGRPGRRAAGHLHRRTAPTRPGGLRPGGPLAQRADRAGARRRLPAAGRHAHRPTPGRPDHPDDPTQPTTPTIPDQLPHHRRHPTSAAPTRRRHHQEESMGTNRQPRHPDRHHRRRQLRVVPRPGRRVLQGRRARQPRSPA